jgi:hypothetical protein
MYNVELIKFIDDLKDKIIAKFIVRNSLNIVIKDINELFNEISKLDLIKNKLQE